MHTHRITGNAKDLPGITSDVGLQRIIDLCTWAQESLQAILDESCEVLSTGHDTKEGAAK